MGKGIKILVIEDEELLLQVITRKLSSLQFEVISCTSARQALDYLKGMTELPNCIWLDYYLEDMNGLDFLRELRKESKYGNIPIVVVSNSASEEKKNAMMALGATRYILKAEHRLDEIVDTIREIVSERQK